VFSETFLAVTFAAYEPQYTLAGPQYSCSDTVWALFLQTAVCPCQVFFSESFRHILHSCNVKHLHISTTAVATDVHPRFSFCFIVSFSPHCSFCMAFHGMSIARNELRDHGSFTVLVTKPVVSGYQPNRRDRGKRVSSACS
jgi:hypothetical protein